MAETASQGIKRLLLRGLGSVGIDNAPFSLDFAISPVPRTGLIAQNSKREPKRDRKSPEILTSNKTKICFGP
jgi:hypothetical protein